MNGKISSFFIVICLLALSVKTNAQSIVEANSKSIQSFGVLPENIAKANKANLQKTIDWASASGAAVFVELVEKPYKIQAAGCFEGMGNMFNVSVGEKQ